MWQQQDILPPSLARRQARTGVNHLGGTPGGVPGGVPRAAVDASLADHIDPLVISTGTLEIIATYPSQAAEQLRNLATVLEVSSRLAEVRGRIEEGEADLRFLHHQVEMSLLTTNITGVAEAQVFGIRWRPLYEVKLSLRGALSAIADYANSMVALFLNLPVIAIWGFTIVALLKAGWLMLGASMQLFFPGLII